MPKHKPHLCQKTLKLLQDMDVEQIAALINRYRRHDAQFLRDEVDMRTLRHVLEDRQISDILLSEKDEDVPVDNESKLYENMFRSGPDWLDEQTFYAVCTLDDNQYDAIIDSYCNERNGKSKAKKLYGFELDQETIEWVKENKPYYLLLE